MRRIAFAFVAFVAVAALLAADKPKAPADTRSRLVDLERRVAELEARLEALEGKPRAAAAAGADPDADPAPSPDAAKADREKPRPLQPKEVMASVPKKLRPAMEETGAYSPLRKQLYQWIDENLVGRRMVVTGTIKDFVPVAGDVFAIGIMVPVPGGFDHYVSCQFPASQLSTARQLKVGNKIRVTGTIESLSFFKIFFLAHLIDGSF
jgi:hypothetical protein